MSDTIGRADMAADPPGGGVTELTNHLKEIGHCAEAKSSGTNVLCGCWVHFL